MWTKEQRAAYAKARYHALSPEQKYARNASDVAKAAKARFRSNPENRRKEYEQNRQWLSRDGNAQWKQFQKRVHSYGLTLDQYHSLAEKQDFVCACCGEAPTPKTRMSSLDHFVVDHDHATMRVRGLLCNGCNIAIGHLRDSASKAHAAMRYLTAHCEASR